MNNLSETIALKVEVRGLKTIDSQVRVALYKDAASWLKHPYLGEVQSCKDGTAIVLFKNVPKGKYAISCFQDLNGNGKLDTNFLGIPKEPYAFSNNANGMFGPPTWEAAAISFNENTSTIIQL